MITTQTTDPTCAGYITASQRIAELADVIDGMMPGIYVLDEPLLEDAHRVPGAIHRELVLSLARAGALEGGFVVYRWTPPADGIDVPTAEAISNHEHGRRPQCSLPPSASTSRSMCFRCMTSISTARRC
jgi:hypothetical protein